MITSELKLYKVELVANRVAMFAMLRILAIGNLRPRSK